MVLAFNVTHTIFTNVERKEKNLRERKEWYHGRKGGKENMVKPRLFFIVEKSSAHFTPSNEFLLGFTKSESLPSRNQQKNHPK